MILPFMRSHINTSTWETAIMTSVKELYTSNKIVKFCTNGGIVLAFIGALWQGTAWAYEQFDGRFARVADVQQLQRGQEQAIQQLEQQGKQLNFMYYDSMKREKSTLRREIYDLRRKPNKDMDEEATLAEMVEDMKSLQRRLDAQEGVISGQSR